MDAMITSDELEVAHLNEDYLPPINNQLAFAIWLHASAIHYAEFAGYPAETIEEQDFRVWFAVNSMMGVIRVLATFANQSSHQCERLARILDALAHGRAKIMSMDTPPETKPEDMN